jgi:hypothetical protein
MGLKIAELTHLPHTCNAEKTVALKKWHFHNLKKMLFYFWEEAHGRI